MNKTVSAGGKTGFKKQTAITDVKAIVCTIFVDFVLWIWKESRDRTQTFTSHRNKFIFGFKGLQILAPFKRCS